MTAAGVLYHPITVFVLSLLGGGALYALGRALAPASRVVGGKLKTYACGENVEAESFPTAYHLYHAAFIFTLLDVVALVIGTATSSAPLTLITAYILVALIAIIILFKD